MTGGAGGDTFVFRALSDSVAGGGRDVIKDFVAGLDTIDLRQIDANAWLANDQAFASSARARLRKPPESCKRRRSAPTHLCPATWTAMAREISRSC